MSYILEALRKSEQERGQSTAADLLRMQGAATQVDRTRPLRGIHAILALVFLAIGVGLGWWQPWSTPLPEPEIQLFAKPEAETTAVIMPEPKPIPNAPVAPVSSGPKPSPRTPVASESAPKEKVPLRVTVQGANVPEKKASPKVAVPAELPPSRERIYVPAELPQPLQDVLSSLAIRGFVYAADAPSRMVVINDRIFREGDEVATDLKIERIEPEAVMLTFKGYRIRAPK